MDITEDNLRATLYHVCKDGVPDYVNNAKILSKEAAEKLPDSLFADRTNRRYPIDTKANTWLSAAYFAKTAENDNYSTKTMKDYVESVIKLAADKHGIRKEVDDVMSRLRAKPAVKSAADDESNYGWPAEKKYPMFDARGVKLACSYFDDNAFKYPPSMRKEIAKRIFTKCAEYGIQPSDRVRAESGEGFQMREFVAAQLADRVRAAGNRGNLKMASALADVMQALLSRPMKGYVGDMDKVAGILDGFDRLNGFDDAYGTRFHSPAEVFHGRSIKEAQAMLDDSIRMGDHVFSITKLAGLPLDLFTDALGDDFGDMIRGTPIASGKVARITKKVPGGVMKITISGGMPELVDGGFGVGDMLEKEKCDPAECEEECKDPKCDDAECPEHGDSEEADVIDVKKLGKALKALPERDLNALRKAIELYAD